MTWGKGWEVGVNKAIYQHRKTQEIAARILSVECGVKHKTGTHELCPRCDNYKRTEEISGRTT
jgi:hypothetical protein